MDRTSLIPSVTAQRRALFQCVATADLFVDVANAVPASSVMERRSLMRRLIVQELNSVQFKNMFEMRCGSGLGCGRTVAA